MIRIARPDAAPASLKRWGEKQTLLDCTDYDASSVNYQTGAARFQWRDYYSKKPIKDVLVAIHCRKCCYCEKRLPPEYLHVEHFRPKGGVRQAPDQTEDELPGYYWLAYRWDNLLLACHACNSTHKKNFFPLMNPTERARSHHDNVANEQTLFVDPMEQDPRLHIRFDRDEPKSRTPEGRETIKGIGLRRPGLREDRLEKIDDINARLAILAGAAGHPENAELQEAAKLARQYIEVAKQPEAEFSSMVIDYLVLFGL
jgi:uncharacterized protein (TIGR02646 family)